MIIRHVYVHISTTKHYLPVSNKWSPQTATVQSTQPLVPCSNSAVFALLQRTVCRIGRPARSVSTLDAVLLVARPPARPPHKFVHQSCWHCWLACEIKHCEGTIAFIPHLVEVGRVFEMFTEWTERVGGLWCLSVCLSLQPTKNDQMAYLRKVMSEFPSSLFVLSTSDLLYSVMFRQH